MSEVPLYSTGRIGFFREGFQRLQSTKTFRLVFLTSVPRNCLNEGVLVTVESVLDTVGRVLDSDQ